MKKISIVLILITGVITFSCNNLQHDALSDIQNRCIEENIASNENNTCLLKTLKFGIRGCGVVYNRNGFSRGECDLGSNGDRNIFTSGVSTQKKWGMG